MDEFYREVFDELDYLEELKSSEGTLERRKQLKLAIQKLSPSELRAFMQEHGFSPEKVEFAVKNQETARELIKKEARKCLRPRCSGNVKTRGLCMDCYNAARGLVGSGRVSWNELEARGKALPPRRRKVDEAKRWFLD